MILAPHKQLLKLFKSWVKIAGTGAVSVAVKLKASRNFDHQNFSHQHTFTLLLESLLGSREDWKSKQALTENLAGIEFVASTAHLVQTWEKGLGWAQRLTLLSVEGKSYKEPEYV